jgi:hypothetical protein
MYGLSPWTDSRRSDIDREDEVGLRDEVLSEGRNRRRKLDRLEGGREGSDRRRARVSGDNGVGDDS